MGTHSVPMIATTSRTATAAHVAGLLPEGAGWAIAASLNSDARSQNLMHAVASPGQATAHEDCALG